MENTITPTKKAKIEKFILLFYSLGMFSIYFSISISQGFFILAFFLFAVRFIQMLVRKETIVLPVTFLLAVAMYVWAGFSDIFNGDGAKVFYIERDVWLYLPVLLIPNITKTKKDIENIFLWIARASIIFGIMGIAEFAFAVSIKALLTKGEIVHLARPYGGAEVSLFTGLTLTYAALYFFPASFFLYKLTSLFQKSYREYFQQFFSKTNLFYFFGFLISVFNILASGKRSAWLGIFVILPFVWWFQTKKKSPLVLGLLAVVLLFTLNSGLQNRITSSLSGQEESTNYRLLMYKASLASSMEKPIFGVGAANYAKLLKEKNVLDINGNALTYGHSHNDFLDRLATGGYPAMLLFIAIFLYMLIKMKNVLTINYHNVGGFSPQDIKDFSAMTITILLVFAVASQFQCYLTDDENLIFFSAILGVGETLIALNKKTA